ncbi:hypothetical protein TIFTF001_009911 [Ficus carica]|uniref:Uncharacterized protein n=1 Tax=Ficus carica TaxID=3494 RepID=A0AA87ZP12_FICCA|nr:hypothetical protein TIFTF001_009911 [Ficus carica]
MLFEISFHSQLHVEPLHSKPNLVYYAPTRPCYLSHPCLVHCSPTSCSSSLSPIFCLPVARFPVPLNPSTICYFPGPPFTVPHSSIPFAYLIVDLLASPTPHEADTAPTGVCKAKANKRADNPLFPSSEIISPNRCFLP